MNIRDQVEFWKNGRPFMIVDSGLAPRIDDLVSIQGVTYKVYARNFAVDYSDSIMERRMRLVVQVKEAKK